MTVQTVEEANAALRQAIEQRMEAVASGRSRLDATPADDPKVIGYKLDQGDPDPGETYAEWTPPGFAATRAEQALHGAIAAVRDRHGKYGPPTEHFARTAALVNAAFNTSFTAADWALVMVLDKIARQRGPGATDDAAIDIAGYAACHQECRQSQ
jgi:hypothetical protein